MPKYKFTGAVTVDVDMNLEADSASDAWEVIEDRLCPKLFLAGYSKFSDIGTGIASKDLAIHSNPTT